MALPEDANIPDDVLHSFADLCKQGKIPNSQLDNISASSTSVEDKIKYIREAVNGAAEVTGAISESLKSKIVNLLTKDQSDELIAELSSNSKLKAAFEENDKLVESWKRAFDIFPTNSKFITDIPTLEKISKLASEGSVFRSKLGSNWSEALDDILETAKDLKCSSCGNAGRVGRSSMDQFLDDVDYFISNFNVNSGGKGEIFYNWMRSRTIAKGKVDPNNLATQLDELHQTIRDLSIRGIKESDVSGLGKAFDVGKPGAALKEYDLRQINNIYTEYKNVDFASNALINQPQSVDQFINGYLRNIESFDKFQWKAGFDKLKSAWGSEVNALTQMKKQWKSVFESKSDVIFEVIWGNQNLKNSLFESGLTKADAKLDFIDMVSSTDDTLFKFVKVE